MPVQAAQQLDAWQDFCSDTKLLVKDHVLPKYCARTSKAKLQLDLLEKVSQRQAACSLKLHYKNGEQQNICRNASSLSRTR